MTITGSGALGAFKPESPGHARSSHDAIPAEAQAGFKKAEAALVASGYKTGLATRLDKDCAAHSYGRVRDFFRSNPCEWLARAYIQIGYSEILVAISWVRMPDTSSAEGYKRLVDTPGAGNVTELSRQTTLYRNINYTGSPRLSGISGTDVWNVQAKPVFPRPATEVNEVLADSRQ